MDHRPFENWLLENKELTNFEKRELNAHLQSCPSCTALAEVDLALKSVKSAAPAEGFTARFQVRLVARKQALRRRNIIGFALLSLGALGLLTWLAWPILVNLFQSPVTLVASWLSAVVSIWAGFQAIFQGGMVLFNVIPDFIPAYVWVLVFLIGGGWCLLWAFSLKKFFKFPQGA